MPGSDIQTVGIQTDSDRTEEVGERLPFCMDVQDGAVVVVQVEKAVAGDFIAGLVGVGGHGNLRAVKVDGEIGVDVGFVVVRGVTHVLRCRGEDGEQQYNQHTRHCGSDVRCVPPCAGDECNRYFYHTVQYTVLSPTVPFAVGGAIPAGRRIFRMV